MKEFDSFFEKANRTDTDGNLIYENPIDQITDVIGFRVIVLARRHVNDVSTIVRECLSVLREEDKAETLAREGRLGYESHHFVATLGPERASFGEYAGICDLPFELQIRTTLQHAWAENEHKIQYKKSKNPELVKRFLRLAAAVSSADEEFDRIYEIDEALRLEVERAVVNSQSPASDDEAILDHDGILAAISNKFGQKPAELIREERYGEAIQVYSRFIEVQPKQPTHYVGRARARALSGDLEGALKDIAVAETLAPNHISVRKVREYFEKFANNY